MGLKGFERRLERVVEGVFARAFKSSLRPVELGRRLNEQLAAYDGYQAKVQRTIAVVRLVPVGPGAG